MKRLLIGAALAALWTPANAQDVRVATLAAIDETPTAAVEARSTGRVEAWIDEDANALGLRAAGVESLHPLDFAGENVCLYINLRDGLPYAFVVGDGGEIEQRLLARDAQGALSAAVVRRLNVPTTATQCVADSASGDLYVAEEAVGVWRFNGDAEADAAPQIVDAPGLGRLSGEVKGVALAGPWLFASDASVGQVTIYDRRAEHGFVGRAGLALDGTPVEESGWLFAQGAELIVQDDAADRWGRIALTDLGETAGAQIGPVEAAAAQPPFPAVMATVETRAVPTLGDAADDPAIWVNRDDPAASLVLGTDKNGGLALYDMAGQQLQYVADGRMNNVDLRDGFRLGDREVVLVTASNRTNRSIAIYVLDTQARRLIDVADGVQPTGQEDPYGLCMYRSARSGETYVFINDSGGQTNGAKRQWRLVATAEGRVRAEQVRDFAFGSQAEGCVADDETGVLYVAEEDVGLWRLSAEPDAGADMTSVEAITDNPALKDDMEGVSLYDLGDGRGYLVASSQGNDSYAVYRREGDQAYLGSFVIVANPQAGIDGASETDGLDVTSADLGPGFESGAVIVQDGRNVLPVETQNYKYVPWSAIAQALNLESRRN